MATVLRSRGSSMASLFLRAPATGVVIQPPPSTTCVVHASTISTLVQGSPATGGLLPRAPGAAAALMKPRSPATMQHMMRSHFRPMSGGGSCQTKTMEKAELDALKKYVEGKDIKKLKLESDLKRFSLAESWRTVPIVQSASTTIDWSSLDTTLTSMKGATFAGLTDFSTVKPFLIGTGVLVLLLLTVPMENSEAIKKKLKEKVSRP